MKSPIVQRLAGSYDTVAIIGGFALLGLAGLGAAAAALASADADMWSIHSARVRQAEAHLLGLIQDAERGQRGYLLTGDATYLAPFATARRDAPAAEAELRALTKDNAAQQSRLDPLHTALGEKFAELSRTVERAQAGALAVVRTNEGRDLMRRIRTTLAEFDLTGILDRAD